MNACAMPRSAAETEIPADQVGDMQQRFITPLDLEGCTVATFTMALNEYELADLANGKVSHRLFPSAVSVQLEKSIAAWFARHSSIIIKGFTQGIFDGCCTIAIHWRPKA